MVTSATQSPTLGETQLPTALVFGKSGPSTTASPENMIGWPEVLIKRHHIRRTRWGTASVPHHSKAFC